MTLLERPALKLKLRFDPALNLLLFLALAGGCAGCRREQITVYHIPKASENLIPMVPTEPAGRPQIKYTLPPDWREEPPAGLSVARFSVAGAKAEVSVMTFPGEGASQLDLVNVVRQTAGLPPLEAPQLAQLVQTADVGGEKGSLIDFSAATQSASNSAFNGVTVAVAPHGGLTWFFKLSGDAGTVTAQQPALIAFLKSVSFIGGEVSPSAAPVASEPSASLPPMGSETPASPAETANRPAWEVPDGWNEVPPTQMLLAKFTVTNADGRADITVSRFPGDVGGLLANVNRWRGQLALAPVTAADLPKTTSSLDVPGGKATLVDMTGTGAKNGKETRLTGVIWPREGETWFYKMTGDAAAVAREREPFLKFIQSVRYTP